ncbi:MAG: helix-turn-helix domain-containing protein [Dehalococcoidia bacterium]
MPRLWNDTIEAHRHGVREAVIEATATLVAERGLLAVTMSEVAERAGIGRATLYKYFPDIESIVLAWHERQIGDHLGHLMKVSGLPGAPDQRLAAVLEAYALIAYESRRQHDGDFAALLHRDQHLVGAEQQLRELVLRLVSDAAAAGLLRPDIPPDELAAYCVHALSAASGLSSKAAVRRLVAVTLAGARP